MMQKYNILIIDDHPLISNAYKNALDFIERQQNDIKFYIEVADNCDSAIDKITKASQKKGNHIFFLDIKLPVSKDKKYLSGEDIGVKIKELFPDPKIIISTTLNDNYRVHSILKNINPDGFLIKNDITPKDLVIAINTVINEPPYYTKTVIQLLRKQMSNDFILDRIDRQLLYELSVGTKMKELPNIIPLSMAGIEKRKRQLKEVFNVKNHGDKELVNFAKEKGYI